MKKWMSIFIATVLSIGILTGCGTENNTDTKDNETNNANQENQDIPLLVGLQMEMIDTIRKDIKQVTNYEATGDEALQEEAVTTSKKIANELRGIEIPSELSDELQAGMKDSVELLAIYFEERAAALTADPDYTEMEAAFAAFHKKIGATFEKAGLHAPNFEKDVI
ncbi:hypothetical protein [Sutcliffiella halmapala]|uniref:hypothetical protein n=1 Tax=Sutcliffiella halmapala TaxID=79882 RepID=UPI0009954431|nr:hypothetical protein [Sutcliffiella halmapala]